MSDDSTSFGGERRTADHGPMVSSHGSAGSASSLRDLRRLAIWQLSGPLERRVVDGIRDDVPSAPAEPIRYFTSDGQSAESSYDDAGDAARSMRVYHVTAFPGDRRSQIVATAQGQAGEVGLPKYTTGDRVNAVWNHQSGRWEIIGPAEDVWRFELKTALVPNSDPDVPSTAAAWLVVYDAGLGRYIATGIEFQVADFLDVWDADAGCRGYARRLADSSAEVGWEVMLMESDFPPCVGDSSSSGG
jgi:hypothetical protein